jgi:hypothetical protein
MTYLAAKPSVLRAQNGEIPPLESGDRLTRAEFMRRYDAMPDLKKAELVKGVVYVPAPVRQKHHGAPHSHLVGWLVTYRAGTPGVETGVAAHNAIGLAGESPVVGIDCLPT